MADMYDPSSAPRCPHKCWSCIQKLPLLKPEWAAKADPGECCYELGHEPKSAAVRHICMWCVWREDLWRPGWFADMEWLDGSNIGPFGTSWHDPPTATSATGSNAGATGWPGWHEPPSAAAAAGSPSTDAAGSVGAGRHHDNIAYQTASSDQPKYEQ